MLLENSLPDSYTAPATAPRLVVFAAIRRSGSTLFMELMSQNPEVGVSSRAVSRPARRSEQRANSFSPEYSIFQSRPAMPRHPILAEAARRRCRILMLKEETGDSLSRGTRQLNECNFPLFPNREAVERTTPIFAIREPVRCFDGWKKRGWIDLDSFIEAYLNIINTYRWARRILPATLCLTYESVVSSPAIRSKLMQLVCRHWGINWCAEMLEPGSRFAEKFIFSSERDRRIYLEQNPLGLFTELQRSREVRNVVPAHEMVTTSERRVIERALTPLYETVQAELAARIAECSDFGSFHRPAATATEIRGRDIEFSGLQV